MKPEFEKELERRLRQVEAPPPPAGLSQALKSDIPADFASKRREIPVRFWSIWGLSWQYGSAVVMIVALSYVTLRLMQASGIPESAELGARIPVRADRPALESNGGSAGRPSAVAEVAVAPNLEDAVAEKADSVVTRQKVAALEDKAGLPAPSRSNDSEGERQVSSGSIAMKAQDDYRVAPPPTNAPPPTLSAAQPQVAADHKEVIFSDAGTERPDLDRPSAAMRGAARSPATPQLTKAAAAGVAESSARTERIAPEKDETANSVNGVMIDLFESPMNRGERVARIEARADLELEISSGVSRSARASSSRLKKESRLNQNPRFMKFPADQKRLPVLRFHTAESGRSFYRDLSSQSVKPWESASPELQREFLSSELDRILAGDPVRRAELTRLAVLVRNLTAISDDRATMRLNDRVLQALEIKNGS